MTDDRRSMRALGLTLAFLAWPAAITGAQASPQASSPTRPPVADSAAALPSVALPPALDRVLRDYERAWRAGDVPALVALFTDDGFVLQPGRAPARGRAALTAAYTGQGGGPLRLRALAYAQDDTVGYIIGAYGYGEDPGDQGKFTLTLRRTPGGPWLIASDMDNGSRPPRRAPAPPVP
jgi:ketosteroid isomerase-like protein